jgi:photosystem II stability/assembly factor-like uncharacterized protein
MLAQTFALLCVLGLFASPAAAASSWKVVEHDYAAIAMSLSFQEQQSGWIAGATSDAVPLLLHTADGGATLQEFPVDVANGVLMSISMFDAQHGIAGALGFVGLPCGILTNDGKTWEKIHDGVDILCAVQDTTSPASNVFVMIGEFSHPAHLGGDGIQISTNGGLSWTQHNWNQNIDARYGKFLSADVGYVTGGEWPNNTMSRFQFPVQLSHHIHHDGNNFKVNREASRDVPGYRGVIALTVDSGKSWKTLVNWTLEGQYFNEISCTDINTCWVVSEGVNKTTGVTAAYIWGTTDGFKTINQQAYFEHGSLMAVNMLNSTYGWAAGADVRRSGINEFKGTFFLTTDGKTWTQNQQIGNFYAMDVSTVDDQYAYAAGLDEVALAALTQYAPR